MRNVLMTLGLVLTLGLAGCGEEAENTIDGAGVKGPVLPASALLAAAPAGAEAVTINELKANATEGDKVVIRAVVGGRAKPFVPQRAIMNVVDATLPRSCGVDPSDPCTTPWDYCCSETDELNAAMATVQIVDAQGNPLKADLGAGPIKPFDTIVLAGTVGPRANAQTLTINADAVYIEKTQ